MPKLLTIQIPQPCGEDPSKMLPSEKGSYCLSCKKEVIDFTEMSDSRLAAFFKNNHDHVCGRFYPDQLNKAIPLPKRELPWLRYFFTIAIPAFLFSMRSSGQVKATHDIEIPAGILRSQSPGDASAARGRILKGIVTDENGNPVEAASVRIVNTSKGTATDENGQFSLKVTPQDLILRVTSIGIITRDVILNTKDSINITVTAQTQYLGEISVVTMAGGIGRHVVSSEVSAKPRTFTGKIIDQYNKPVEAASVRVLNSRRGTVTDPNGAFEISLHRKDAVISISGIGIVTKEISVAQQSTGDIIVERIVEDLEKVTVVTTGLHIKRTPMMLGGAVITSTSVNTVVQQKPLPVKDNANEITIYPNPIHSGSELNISWKNKVQADQLIEIFSAEGRIVQQETVRVTGKISACSFVLQNTAPGFYIFMVTDAETGKKISKEFIVE